MTEKLIIIKDELIPKPDLDCVLNLCYEKRIDRLIGHSIDPEVQIYLKEATAKLDTERQSRMSDESLKNKLFFILKSIDKSLLNKAEATAYDKILDKYRC